MKNLLIILPIFLFSLTIISCAKKDEEKEKDTAPSYVAVGDSGNILTSSDVTTWISRTSGTTNRLYGVTYGNGSFVTVGRSGTILTSSDGITWTSKTSGTTQKIKRVTNANRKFVKVGC